MRYSSYPDPPPKQEIKKFVSSDNKYRSMRNQHMRHTIETLPTQTRTTTRNRISFDPAKDNLAVTLENIEPESLNTDRTMTDRLNTDRKSNTLR